VTSEVAIGVDIGGTKVAAGIVDSTGTVLATARRLTPAENWHAVRQTIGEAVLELIPRAHALGLDPVGVGIGAAGLVDADRSRVVFAPHLALRGEPIAEAVAKDVGIPVVIENDANAAAWAEWRFGAGQGQSRLVCVTLGTGIGGGMVDDGEVQRGQWGMAGEFGHMVFVPDGHPCECGNRGCLEQYASGNVLGRRARELIAAGAPEVAPLLKRAGGDPAALLGPLITEAAQDGDPLSIELFEQVGHWLGIGLANIAAALDPGMFVIGGGVSDAGELLLGPARRSFAQHLLGRRFRPPAQIKRVALGAAAGLIGAADLALNAPAG
jgi:glucokinase